VLDVLTKGLRELSKARTVLSILVWQQLILRYRRTLLGYVWSLINPILMMSIMSVVFASLFKADLKTFTVFLFTGMIPWSFFNASVTQSSMSLISNESLIRKIYLPKTLFPLSVCITLFIDSISSFFSLFIIMLLIGAKLSLAVFFIPVAYLLLFIFTLGISFIIAVATVYFRDLQHIIVIGMQALFFLTPIFYKRNSLFGKVEFLVNLNPLTTFVELFRSPLYLSQIPTETVIFKAILFASLAILIGLMFFLRFEKKIVFRL